MLYIEQLSGPTALQEASGFFRGAYAAPASFPLVATPFLGAYGTEPPRTPNLTRDSLTFSGIVRLLRCYVPPDVILGLPVMTKFPRSSWRQSAC